MAGGFMNRILYYVINEVVVNGLANRYIQTPSFYHIMFLTLYLIKDDTSIHQAMCLRYFLIDPDEIGVGIVRNLYVSGDMTCFGWVLRPFHCNKGFFIMVWLVDARCFFIWSVGFSGFPNDCFPWSNITSLHSLLIFSFGGHFCLRGGMWSVCPC